MLLHDCCSIEITVIGFFLRQQQMVPDSRIKMLPLLAYDLLHMCFFRCDADPQALAKYVVALVKKDKTENNLRALCKDQLDVFLQKGKFSLLLCMRFR